MLKHRFDERENITVTAIDIIDSNKTPWRFKYTPTPFV